MDKKELTEKILNHALGIIYLLTGEEYVVVKKNPQHITTHEETGEIPIKCGDISISFSMEEWNYIEEHRDLYREVMVNSHQSISATRVPSSLNADMQEDGLDCVSINNATEDTEKKEDVEPPAVSTETLKEDDGNKESIEQVEDVLEENEGDKGLIDITGHSVVMGTVEESRHEALGLEESLETTYVSQYFPYDVVNLICNAAPDEYKSFSLAENVLPENSAPWQDVQTFRRKSRKQELHSKNDYLEVKNITENQLDEFKNDFSYRFCEPSTPYICGECGRSFISEPSLAEHMRRHWVEKPHLCNQCGRVFEYRSRLLVHQRTHNGDKPHKCQECGKDFNYKSRLLVHLRKHTGVKPHKCNQCGKQFDYKSHLLRHLRTHT